MHKDLLFHAYASLHNLWYT